MSKTSWGTSSAGTNSSMGGKLDEHEGSQSKLPAAELESVRLIPLLSEKANWVLSATFYIKRIGRSV